MKRLVSILAYCCLLALPRCTSDAPEDAASAESTGHSSATRSAAPGESDAARAVRERALALHAAGQRDEAIDALERAVQSGLASAPIHSRLAALSLEAERILPAHQHALRALELDPRSTLAHEIRALLEIRNGDHESAVGTIEQLLELRPRKQASDYELLGRACARLSRDDEAQRAYNQALKLDPDRTTSLYGLGVLAMRAGDWATAEQHFVRTLELDAEFDRALFNLANVYRRSGQTRKAEAAFAALEQNKTARQSIGRLRNLIAERPQDPELYCELGAAWWKLRDAEAATGAYQRALAAVPRHRRALRELSQIALRSGYAAAALEMVRDARRAEPSDAELREIEQRLLDALSPEGAPRR